MPGGLDETELDRLGQVARLYLIVNRRPPDPVGLATYVQALREGQTLQALAAAFLAAEEFTARVPPAAALQEVRRNAGSTEPGPPAGTLAEEVARLVESDAARSRLPLLPALYPDGIPLDDRTGYRLWLAEHRPVPPKSDTGRRITFVMPLAQPVPRAQVAAAMAAAVAAAAHRGAALLIVVRTWAPAWLKTLAANAPTNAPVTIHVAPPWSTQIAMTERGMARATTDLVAAIDPDSLLDPAAARILAGPDADILLADDDHLDDHGRRHTPRLGSAWDSDRTRAAGPIGLVAMRTDLVRQAMAHSTGRRRAGQGAPLLLGVAALTTPDRIAHIPEILLTRRTPAPARAPARAPASSPAHIVYPMPATPPRVSIVIPTRDRAPLLRACTEGLLHRTAYPDLQILIVDNGSTEPDALRLLATLESDSRVRILPRPGPFNWSALNNAAVAAIPGATHGDIVVLLNNDIQVIEPRWLHELVTHASRPEVGAVGAKLLYPDGRIQHAGVVIGPPVLGTPRGTHVWRFSPGDAPGYLDQLRIVRQVSAVTGACLAIRRDVYDQAGGCDEALPVTWNDVDLCLRVRALGHQVIWTPHAVLTHHEQATRGPDDTPERIALARDAADRMRARWGKALDHDPFWSPHLRPAEGPDEIEPRLATQHPATQHPATHGPATQ